MSIKVLLNLSTEPSVPLNRAIGLWLVHSSIDCEIPATLQSHVTQFDKSTLCDQITARDKNQLIWGNSQLLLPCLHQMKFLDQKLYISDT